jgi:hypothetical protein
MFDKIPRNVVACMNMARTTKQKWLIGCLSAAGALVVLGGLAVGGFLMFMKWLCTVPPESTQIVLYNDTDEQLRIDRIIYGNEDLLKDSIMVLEVYDHNKFTRYDASVFRTQIEMSKDLSVLYTGLSSGRQWRVDGALRRLSGRPCGFNVYLRSGTGEISSCGYNELQDFEGD